MHGFLFANGCFNDGLMVQRVLADCDAPHVVCADGGALLAQALGFAPSTIIGDFDSLTPAQAAAFEAGGAQLIKHPPEKDETDLELSLYHCLELGASKLTILGATGGRIDQTLANIQLLVCPAWQDLPIAMVDGAQAIKLLRPGSHELSGRAGDTISLLPLSEAVAGIRTRQLKYPLRHETLVMGPARGISNVMLADVAEIAFDAGLLLLIHTVGRA